MNDEKTKQPRSMGNCNLCDRSLAKRGMTRHLQSCLKKHADRVAAGKKKMNPATVFHLVVEDRWYLDYWLHLLVPANAVLATLDQFLRDTWLECCHHLSAFTIDGRRYNYAMPGGFGLFGADEDDEEDLGEDEEEDDENLAEYEPGEASLGTGARKAVDPFGLGDPFDIPEDRDMNVTLGKVLRPKLQFDHEYDFGTTTELILKVASKVEAPLADDAIFVMARNDPPDIRCAECDKPATEICTQCMYDEHACFCDDCARKHECEEEMFLPVVNSPRMGVCGYCGPGDQQ